jgi:hypothetical protein
MNSELTIQVKTVKLSKSKILQLEYIGVPRNRNVEVLGWVNIGNERFVIIKSGEYYYRAAYLNKVDYHKEMISVPILDENGKFFKNEYVNLTKVWASTFNGQASGYYYSPELDDSKNIELYEHLKSYQKKIENSIQIFY